jgi:hypothetical protein
MVHSDTKQKPSVAQESPEKCQSIIVNLLHLLTKDSGIITSEAFVRELAQAEHCVSHQPKLEPLVDSYRTFVTPAAYDRLQRFEQTPKDEQRCTAALVHYRYWTRTQLRQSLPWHLQAKEICSANAAAAFAEIGIASSLFFASRGASAILERSYDKMSSAKKNT